MFARSRWVGIGLALAVVLLFAGIRWRLRTMPLERDEGEYAYAGQLILQGIPPYQIAYNMKLPGIYVAYAAILRAFGETATGVHLGLILLNGCATLLMFLLARRLYGDLGAVAAAASYGLLSTSEAVLGLAGHATHFVVLMALAGLLFLLAARKTKKLPAYFAAGLCLGLAFLMKQPGAVFVLFGAQVLALAGWKDPEERKKLLERLSVYGAGAAIPYVLTCVALYRAGVFGKFWFWTVSYASQYGTSTGILQGMKYLFQIVPQLFYGAPVVWCFAAIGIIALLRERGRDAFSSFEIGLLAWSFVGVSAGLYYRDHYFILLLPAVCLLAGFAVKWSSEEITRRMPARRLGLAPAALLPLTIFAAGFAASLYAQRAIFFQLQPDVVSRVVYGGSPFPEAVEFGKYIQEHSDANAKVAVLGSEPEIYFYSQRHSATGYIYTYGLMEEQKYASRMQQEMIGEIEKERPEFLVKVMIPGSWLRKTNSDTTILYWADKYIGEEYRIVGVVEIGAATNYRWDQDAVGYVPRSKYSVYLYKRRV
jgi:4-amino-4-deoxy-L-arabinose transferase-like glycosyltransferase